MMPIVDVELITGDEPEPGLAGRLAEEIGRALAAAEGTTWVRLRLLPPEHYGESGPFGDDVRPVFVTIMAYERPAGDELRRTVAEVTATVAALTGHAGDNVHVIYTPDARGRVAFGGELRR